MNPYQDEEPVRSRDERPYPDEGGYRRRAPRRRPAPSRSAFTGRSQTATIARIAAIGAVVFFVGLLVTQLPLFYEEPHEYDYEYDEYEDYQKDQDEHDQSIRSTMGVGRVVSSVGLILVGYALFTGGIEIEGIPENARRAMIYGATVLIAATIIATFLFSGFVLF